MDKKRNQSEMLQIFNRNIPIKEQYTIEEITDDSY